jgi:hypothetical protein
MPYEVYVTKDGFLPNEFTNSMEESYQKYIKNENIDLKHIYNMSMCPNIYVNRRRLLYKDCFEMFDSNKSIYDGINKFCDKSIKSDEKIGNIYKLKGISNHHGGLNGGHYTADCNCLITDNWYHFNDSNVSRHSSNNIDTSSAYILLYELQ